MLTVGPTSRVFLAIEPIDMRGSFRSLAGAARLLGLDPADGHLYVFLSRRRNIAKILYFDRSGWCVFMKRLERGSFELPVVREGSSQVCVDPTALHLLLQGIDLGAPRRRWHRRDAAIR